MNVIMFSVWVVHPWIIVYIFLIILLLLLLILSTKTHQPTLVFLSRLSWSLFVKLYLFLSYIYLSVNVQWFIIVAWTSEKLNFEFWTNKFFLIFIFSCITILWHLLSTSKMKKYSNSKLNYNIFIIIVSIRICRNLVGIFFVFYVCYLKVAD